MVFIGFPTNRDRQICRVRHAGTGGDLVKIKALGHFIFVPIRHFSANEIKLMKDR